MIDFSDAWYNASATIDGNKFASVDVVVRAIVMVLLVVSC